LTAGFASLRPLAAPAGSYLLVPRAITGLWCHPTIVP